MSATALETRPPVRQFVRELWCGRCGYGVVVRRDPPECPMCREVSWLERAPLARCN